MEPRATRQTASATEVTVRVTAVVLVEAEPRAIDLCLRAALADPWVDELVVVDCGASDAVGRSLRGLRADRRNMVLLNARGVGRAEAWNLAAAHARGRFLLFVGPNVVLKRGAAARLVSAGRRAPNPWIVGGRLFDARGDERPSVRWRLPSALSALFGAGRLSRFSRRTFEAAQVAAVGDALLLTPRIDFEALRGFDPGAPAGMESLDLCRRAAQAGGVVRFAPRAEAVEFIGPGDARAEASKEARGLSAYLEAQARTLPERIVATGAGKILRGLAKVGVGRPRGG